MSTALDTDPSNIVDMFGKPSAVTLTENNDELFNQLFATVTLPMRSFGDAQRSSVVALIGWVTCCVAGKVSVSIYSHLRPSFILCRLMYRFYMSYENRVAILVVLLIGFKNPNASQHCDTRVFSFF